METLSLDALLNELEQLRAAEMDASVTLHRVTGARMLCEKLIADVNAQQSSESVEA